MTMNMVDIIRKKRDGYVLSREEFAVWVQGAVKGEVPDYQSSAMLMACFLRGLNEDETFDLTMEMLHSGDVFDWSDLEGTVVDKHSTGGVGDKTTLILAPILAAGGLKVAKLSGRGLGHTGGTLDKLESIAGLSVDIPEAKFRAQVRDIGIAVGGQTAELAPADKIFYSLRDVTATVDSIPLIAASIMSKKLAIGADALVLDVKYGSGGFMPTAADARRLAEAMIDIAKKAGHKATALITPMNQPLGMAVGNALEIAEAIDVLENGTGARDLVTVVLSLAAELFYNGGKAESREAGLELAKQLLESGAARDKFYEMVKAQGGSLDFSRLPKAPLVVPVTTPKAGFIAGMDALAVGRTALELGAGRRVKTDVIDPAAGLVLYRKCGDYVDKDEIIAAIHCRDARQAAAAAVMLSGVIRIEGEAPEAEAMVADIVE